MPELLVAVFIDAIDAPDGHPRGHAASGHPKAKGSNGYFQIHPTENDRHRYRNFVTVLFRDVLL